MEFLGVGYQEVMLILVLALVFLGPERLPEVAYQVGRAVRTMQRYAREVRNEFREEIAYVDEQYRVMRGELQTLNNELRTQGAVLNADLEAAATPLQSAIAEARVATTVESAHSHTAPGAGEDAVGSASASGPPLVF